MEVDVDFKNLLIHVAGCGPGAEQRSRDLPDQSGANAKLFLTVFS